MTAETNNTDRFVYVSSWDHLTWCVDVNNCGAARCNINWKDRPEVRMWIETCCTTPVYCWNGTSTPDYKHHSWHKMISPVEDRCYLVFSQASDQSLFHLKFQSLIEITVFDRLLSAYHDSKN